MILIDGIFLQSIGIVDGNMSAINQYEFFKGLEMNDMVVNNQYEFFTQAEVDGVKQGNQYEFFKAIGVKYSLPIYDEYTFYQNSTFNGTDIIGNQYNFYKEVASHIYTGPSAPVANFTVSDTLIVVGTQIDFTDTSTKEPTSWLWNFGDGNTSTLQNPTHTYTIEGTFDVSLTSTNSLGSDTKTLTDLINVGSVPVASFTSDTQSIEPNETITFTNTSTGSGGTYLWDFGDGNTSTLENPTHTYTIEGTFNVSLEVTNLWGVDTETKVGYITSLGIVPVASFTADTQSIEPNETVTFTNTSTDGDTYLWNFGDGNTSTLKNPTHTYTIEGTFDVSLEVTNIYGSDTETKVGYIEVAYIIPPFTMKIDLSLPGGTTNGFKIPFTFRQTSFPLEIDWGDGSSDIITSWDQAETEHIYSTSGIYDISIIGTLNNMSFLFPATPYRDRLIEVGGTLDIISGADMFYGCSNLSQCNIISLDNLKDGNGMFRNNNLTSWDIDLPNLRTGEQMFGYNNLTSWDIELPNLEVGIGMLRNNNLTSWTIELPNLEDGSYMFYNNSLTSWDVELPELTDGFNMFRENNLTSWTIELPNLEDGSYMFYNNSLTSWDVELPELTVGDNMFRVNYLTSWTIDLPNLVNGTWMFANNGGLISWDAELPNLEDGSYMFVDDRLTSWDVELPNLENGGGMFSRNSLTSWTIELPNLTNGEEMFYFNFLTSWTVGLPNLESGNIMFNGNTINTIDYSNLLVSMEVNNLNDNVTLSGGDSKYNSSAVSARANLVGRGWNISDGGPE